MEQVLITEKKLQGHYVALEDLAHPTPIADGNDPQEVFDAAVKKGFPAPLLIYVPIQGLINIYNFNGIA